MENLTVNQVHKKYAANMQFSTWVDSEVKLYNSLKKDFKKPIDFITWLNKRYEMSASANGLFGQIADTLHGVSQTISPEEDTAISDELSKQNEETAAAKQDTRIFGLQPAAFIGVVIVFVSGLAFAAYKIIKSYKK